MLVQRQHQGTFKADVAYDGRLCVSHRLSIHVVRARTMPEYLANDLSEYEILLELSAM